MTPQARSLEPLAEQATALLKSLAHPGRLMICCQLRERELSVSEIETLLDIRQPRLSRELAKLREEGLVIARKEARQVYYSLNDQSLVRVMMDAICTVMLAKTAPQPSGPHEVPALTRRPVGGYGVFAKPLPLNEQG